MAKNDELAALEGTLGAGALATALMAEGLVTEGGAVAAGLAQLGEAAGMRQWLKLEAPWQVA